MSEIMVSPAIEFESLNERAAAQLRRTALEVERAGQPFRRSWTVPFADLNGDAMDEIVDHISRALGKSCRSLYTFSISDDCTPEQIRLLITHAKEENSANRALPRINPAADCPESRVLYVGTSRNTGARIRQHLGAGNAGTYALHLSWWASGLAGSVQIDVHEYGQDTPDEMLVVLEEQLARELKPILGRRGSR